MEKPDGLTALTHDLLPQALLRLGLRDLVVVFEINKNDYANDLQELQAKTGVKVSMEKAKR